jgi:hypothetical protein
VLYATGYGNASADTNQQRSVLTGLAAMTDMLIRDVPDDVIAAPEAHARRLGPSHTEYVRRRLAQDAAVSGSRSAPRTWRASPPPSARSAAAS